MAPAISGADHRMLEKQVTSMGEDFSPNMATQVWIIWFFISIAAMLEVVFHNTIRWLKESTYHSWKPCSCCFMFLILTVFLCFFSYLRTYLLASSYLYLHFYLLLLLMHQRSKSEPRFAKSAGFRCDPRRIGH